MFTREAFTAFSQPHKLPIMATTEVTTPSTTSLADIGLLILRIGVGAAMIQAGLRKAVDFSTVVTFMESGGWRLPEVRRIHGDRGRNGGWHRPAIRFADAAGRVRRHRRDDRRVGGQRLRRRVLVRSVQRPVPDCDRRGCAAVHRGWRLLRRRQNLWKLAIRRAGRGGTPGPGARRGAADLDIAERS